MLTGQCITSRPLPVKEGKKPLHIVQILVDTRSGPQVVDVFHDQPCKPSTKYTLVPDVYMGKLSLSIGSPA